MAKVSEMNPTHLGFTNSTWTLHVVWKMDATRNVTLVRSQNFKTQPHEVLFMIFLSKLGVKFKYLTGV